MRFLLLISLLFFQVIGMGCQEGDETISNVTDESPTDAPDLVVVPPPAVGLPDEAAANRETERNQKITKHLENFLRLLPNNPEAAFTEMEAIAELTYGDHPLADEWVHLTFKFVSEGKALILELIHLREIEIQMLKDIDAEKHAAEIEATQETLEQMHKQVAKLKAFDIDPKTHKVGYKMAILEE